MKGTFKFYLDGGRWYIDIPEYVGPKADLEMVMGADTMLDNINPGTGEVFLTMSDEPFEIANLILLPDKKQTYDAFPLTKIRDTPEYGGAMYYLDEWYGTKYEMEMWLCEVVRFVFGKLPDVIYLS